MTHEYTDWRGTPIKVGQSALASGVVDDRMAHFELEIEGIEPDGTVRVNPVRHSIHVAGPQWSTTIPVSWLTIVDLLPATDRPTATEGYRLREAERLARYEERLAQLDAGAQPVFVREREITLTRLEKIRAALA